VTTAPHPEQLFVEVTSNCNLACPHCYVEAGAGKLRQLDFDTVVGAITEFRDMGGSRFTLSGGEPTLHKRWRDILTAALDAGLFTEIITNGTRLMDRDIAFLADHPVALDVSLDAARAARHDAIRGTGSFAKTTATIEALLALGLGPRITVCFSPMRGNWDELEALFDWAEMRGIARVYISLLEDRGRAHDRAISLLEWQKVRMLDTILRIKARAQETNLEVPNLRYFPERLLGQSLRVDAIDRTLRLTADRDLYLTAYLDGAPFQLGPYERGRLAAAWYCGKVERAFLASKAREFLIADCRSCSIFDLCQSGSAMLGWSEQRGFFDVDGYCRAKRTYVHDSMMQPGYGYTTVSFVA
jgi:MoaA/NifB/PqqE/SkfB family radical SAM enzyme